MRSTSSTAFLHMLPLVQRKECKLRHDLSITKTLVESILLDQRCLTSCTWFLEHYLGVDSAGICS